MTPYKFGGAQTARTFSAGTTTRKITGLLTGGPYTFTVTATNARGTSPASAGSAVVKIT